MNASETRTADRDKGREHEAASTGCCGGPAPAGTNACCAEDAAVKVAGGSGCGCASQAVEPTRRKASCCG
jgi:hypothetical protein